MWRSRMRTGWRLGRSAAAVETRVFVCRAGFSSRGRTVGRDPDGPPSRPVRDPRCLGSRPQLSLRVEAREDEVGRLLPLVTAEALARRVGRPALRAAAALAGLQAR